MQEELPPSSAWCWHTLKFITLVICWVGERGKILHEKNHSRVEEMPICFTKRGKPERPRGLFCSPFLCCEGVCCVAVSSCSCHRLSSSFISLSYSTHSGTILAAAVSFGSFVFGLLHYSRGKKSRQNTSLTPPVPFSPSKSYRRSQHSLWQAFKPNSISNSVKGTLAHVLCLNYQVVSYTTMRQCFLFQSTGAHPLIL